MLDTSVGGLWLRGSLGTLLLSQESQGPSLGSHMESSWCFPVMNPRVWLDVGCDGTDGLGGLGVGGGDVFPGRNSPAWELPWSWRGSFCSSQVKLASREREVCNDTEPGLETASLTPPRFELSQGCGVSGAVAQPPPEHPDPGTTPKPGRDAPREATLPGHHGSIPGMLIPQT